jgi:hypothetical protein
MSNYISKAETNKIIRQCLKEAFQGVKFSVKGSGRDATRIYWTNGPTVSQVNNIVNRFQSSGFDGMTDYQYNIYQEMNGEKVSFMTDYIFTDRSISDEITQQIIDKAYQENKTLFIDSNEPAPTLTTWYNCYLTTGGDHFIQQVREKMSKISFTTTSHSPTANSVKVTGNELEKINKAEEQAAAKDGQQRSAKAIKEIEQLELDLKPTMFGTVKIKSVFVKWSESSALKSETSYTFAEFEAITQAEALKGDYGYYKTAINVIFDDENEYACRLDISPGCNGFYQHMIAIVAHFKKAHDYRASVYKSNPELAKFYLHFFQTYDLNLTSEPGRANVIDLNQFRAQKSQKASADNFAFAMVDAVKLPEFNTEALKLLTQACKNIMYFSGDVEPGEARNVKAGDPADLLRAAGNLQYQVSMIPDAVRLSFDGEYIYNLYFHAHVNSELQNKLLVLLAEEQQQNKNKAEKLQNAFNKSIENLLKH